MKKRIVCVFLLLCALALTSCHSVHQHKWNEWEILSAADCEHAGYRERSCSCGETEIEEVAATGHSFDEGKVISPTPARSGYTLYTCQACAIEKKENVVGPLGSKGLAYEVNADGKTCTVTGLGTCKDTEIGIPATIDGYTVTAIGNNAFAKQGQITFVWMDSAVKTVGDMAFGDCIGLAQVTLPSSLEQIGTDAFLNCYKLVEVVNLSSLTLKSGSTANGRVAFYAIGISSGESKIVEENDFLFYDHEKEIYLIGYIGSSASLVLPKDFKGATYQLQRYAFANMGDQITSVTFTAPVEIGAYAFRGCEKLEKVEINDLKAWCQTNFIVNESNPIYYAKKLYLNGELLTNAVLPDGTLFIQPNAFVNCESLQSITIPQSVLGIGDHAFAGCKSLVSASYLGSAAEWNAVDLGKGNEPLTDHLTH